MKGQGHRVKFLGERIHHALCCPCYDFISYKYISGYITADCIDYVNEGKWCLYSSCGCMPGMGCNLEHAPTPTARTVQPTIPDGRQRRTMMPIPFGDKYVCRYNS